MIKFDELVLLLDKLKKKKINSFSLAIPYVESELVVAPQFIYFSFENGKIHVVDYNKKEFFYDCYENVIVHYRLPDKRSLVDILPETKAIDENFNINDIVSVEGVKELSKYIDRLRLNKKDYIMLNYKPSENGNGYTSYNLKIKYDINKDELKVRDWDGNFKYFKNYIEFLNKYCYPNGDKLLAVLDKVVFYQTYQFIIEENYKELRERLNELYNKGNDGFVILYKYREIKKEQLDWNKILNCSVDDIKQYINVFITYDLKENKIVIDEDYKKKYYYNSPKDFLRNFRFRNGSSIYSALVDIEFEDMDDEVYYSDDDENNDDELKLRRIGGL